MNTKAAHALVAEDPPYLAFLLWLLVACASLLGLGLAARSGALAFVVEHDLTYISDAILLIFLLTTAVCGRRAWLLSRELLGLQAFAQGSQIPPAAPWVSGFMTMPRSAHSDQQAAVQALQEKLRGPHEIGWFITETLTKLGLLGTVIGFLVMLTALIGSSQLDITAMQSILRDMAAGMGIKIIATVVGLLCNMILALQWVMLDRCAEKILAGAMVVREHVGSQLA